jgi:hypothetical protein
MTILDIMNIINSNIKDHNNEIKEVEKALFEFQQQNRDIKVAQKVMILKDKALFHNACMLVLKDLLEEIENEENKESK